MLCALTFLWLSLLCVGGGLGVMPEMLHDWLTATLAVASLACLSLGRVPPIAVVVVAGAIAWMVGG
jgi:hypothetical protein